MLVCYWTSAQLEWLLVGQFILAFYRQRLLKVNGEDCGRLPGFHNTLLKCVVPSAVSNGSWDMISLEASSSWVLCYHEKEALLKWDPTTSTDASFKGTPWIWTAAVAWQLDGLIIDSKKIWGNLLVFFCGRFWLPPYWVHLNSQFIRIQSRRWAVVAAGALAPNTATREWFVAPNYTKGTRVIRWKGFWVDGADL